MIRGAPSRSVIALCSVPVPFGLYAVTRWSLSDLLNLITGVLNSD